MGATSSGRTSTNRSHNSGFESVTDCFIEMQLLDAPVDVPARLLQVFDLLGGVLLPGAADVLHRVAKTEVQLPRLDNLDGLVRVVRTSVVRGVVPRSTTFVTITPLADGRRRTNDLGLFGGHQRDLLPERSKPQPVAERVEQRPTVLHGAP